MRHLVATLVLLASTVPVSAQWLTLKTPGIPRTADGMPNLAAPAPKSADGHTDLSGLWRGAGVRGDLRDESKIQPWAPAAMAEHESN